jgi:hypothetical protein
MNASASMLFSLTLLPLTLAACGGTADPTGGGGSTGSSTSASTSTSTEATTSTGSGPALSPEMQMAKFWVSDTFSGSPGGTSAPGAALSPSSRGR